ncbi:uncharacterized protein LOC129952575 [Eupeodes corollae]|uniref:uncharacterized protein LOC129952575 n=1 Tax=Eupeodes corollae TaxID=290404 RepID=UPI002492F2DA|nr:uncharacterized protein LOC129952575 [Eupeodes corollae]XP_055921200.1 uncharacterized protein LOC129952575 [Eupeodes corollae]XP_055921201.1 uncharacterized protein LOC129952575 [Eupeodes corollae]XP_055921203.1 uncharacterized protein LOC129952575 [Eupeodes corollae]
MEERKYNLPADGCENYYQISDDDIEDNDENGEESVLEDPSTNDGRNPYERAWSTEATRALIHIRGPMEEKFTEGRQKRTALWLSVTRHLQKLGFRYNAAKVQKKWHNILITYNKNLNKKFLAGYVHWEFFEEMFKYLQGKKAECDTIVSNAQFGDESQYPPDNSMLQPQIEMHGKSADEYEESSGSPERKKTKFEYNNDHHEELPLEITHENGNDDYANGGVGGGGGVGVGSAQGHWWKDYFERKLTMDKEKIDLQREMHRDMMHFNKMSLIQQEKIERIKIDAINNLTSTLQKFVEVKSRKN